MQKPEKQGIEISALKRVAGVFYAQGENPETTVTFAHVGRKKNGDAWEDFGATVWFRATFWNNVDGNGMPVTVQKGETVWLRGKLGAFLTKMNDDGSVKSITATVSNAVIEADGVAQYATPAAAPATIPADWAEVPF